MKHFLLIIILAITTISCVKKEAPVENQERIKIPRSLSKSQIQDIERIQKVFSEVEHSSLEKTMDKFRREENPANEIKIWMQMADAYELFLQNNKTIDQDKKQQAFELILLRSMMTEAEVRDKIKSSALSEKEIKELLSYYTFEPAPLEEEMK